VVIEVDLKPGSRVIADLHLGVIDLEDVQPFLRWLEELGDVPRLLILGDLFDYWVGPAQARFAGTSHVLAGLATRVAGGTAVDIVPGNRDFLLGTGFERLTGCRVHHGGLVGTTPAGQRVLFVHGDELSTLDRNYQRMRRVLRTRLVRWTAPRLPGLADLAARRLRRVSSEVVEKKPRAEVEMQVEAARTLAERHRAGLVVCGHGHRYREEPLGGDSRWIVLDAFGGERDTLEVASGGDLALSGAPDG